MKSSEDRDMYDVIVSGGGPVGLGLAIATDIARAHGGVLRLGQSEKLGGLRADIVIAR